MARIGQPCLAPFWKDPVELKQALCHCTQLLEKLHEAGAEAERLQDPCKIAASCSVKQFLLAEGARGELMTTCIFVVLDHTQFHTLDWNHVALVWVDHIEQLHYSFCCNLF